MPPRSLRFTKLSGAGNDFVLVDNRRRIITRPKALAQRLCDRRFGIGADGLLLLERSKRADYTMKYYNADGTDGGMCGNGGRCIAWYAVAKRIAPRRHRFEALGHVYEAEVRRSEVSLHMKDISWPGLDEAASAGDRTFRYHRIDTGAPHAVLLLPQQALSARLDDIPVEAVGRVLRSHDAFAPTGTNVDFVEPTGERQIRMRTYERGVEAETLACGTGSIACAVAAHISWGYASPVTVTTASGRTLSVRFRRDGNRFVDVFLAGPAEITFEGTVHV
jgi:diaminopimelate epimerase